MLVFKCNYQVLKPTIMIQLSTMNYRLDMKMGNKLIRDGSWKLVKHLIKIEEHLHCRKKITKIDWERCHLNLWHLKFCCCIYAKNYQLVVQTSKTIYCNKNFFWGVFVNLFITTKLCIKMRWKRRFDHAQCLQWQWSNELKRTSFTLFTKFEKDNVYVIKIYWNVSEGIVVVPKPHGS